MTSGRRRWGRWALPALFASAAVVATAPAVADVGGAFVADDGGSGHGEAASGDHLQTTYRFWLVGHQLARGEPPWIDPYSFQPLVEPQTVLGGWPFGLPFWPLDALWGPAVAWNLLLLGVTLLAGLLAYLWLRELDLPPVAAAAGGLAFELAPYRLVQSGGHLLGWAAVFVPLALWAVERARRAGTARASHLWGALAAAATASIPLSGQLHLALGALPLIVVYAALRFERTAALWAWGGVAAGAAAGFLVESAVLAESTEADGRTLDEVAYYSAGPVDLVSRWRLGNLEQFVYLGWLVPALAVGGLVLLTRRRPGLALLLGVAAAVPTLLALGTNLPLYEPLREAFPPLRYPRVPGRLLPIANLALAALVAVAAAAVLARVGGRRKAAVASAVFALVAGDLLVFPLRASEADAGNAAYAALAASPPGLVLELPILERGRGHFGSVYQYYALQAPRQRPTGYALAPDAVFAFAERFNRLDCGIWLPGDREALERLGLRHVVSHAGVYEQSRTPGAWFAWEALRRAFDAVAADGAVVLWSDGRGEAASTPPPPGPEPDRGRPFLCDAWDAGELRLAEGGLWLHGSGRAEIVLSSTTPAAIEVLADGRALRRPAGSSAETTFVADLRGEGWHSIVVRGEPGLRLLGAGFR